MTGRSVAAGLPGTVAAAGWPFVAWVPLVGTVPGPPFAEPALSRTLGINAVGPSPDQSLWPGAWSDCRGGSTPGERRPSADRDGVAGG
ncbi:hypothetical protein SAMN05216284_11739 [Micromonospora sediminimaris]|nr:hypothetical protein SAMN05216284_11739 [Micromonospora sediminimaris]